MLQEWLAAVGDDYAAVVWRPEGEPRWSSGGGRRGCHQLGLGPLDTLTSLGPRRPYPDEEGPKHWTRERHQFLMELKQEALTFARTWGADYILVRKPARGLGQYLLAPSPL